MFECSDSTPEIIQNANLNYVVDVFSYPCDPVLHRAPLHTLGPSTLQPRTQHSNNANVAPVARKKGGILQLQ
jgi:hypothetical protein